MNMRKGEKIGWTGGWMGGFIWVLALSILFFFQGKVISGLSGLIILVLAVFSILYYSPWRHPSTYYWKLMVAPYLLFLVGVVWSVWSFGGLSDSGLKWWNFLWLLWIVTPAMILSKRRWEEGK